MCVPIFDVPSIIGTMGPYIKYLVIVVNLTYSYGLWAAFYALQEVLLPRHLGLNPWDCGCHLLWLNRFLADRYIVSYILCPIQWLQMVPHLNPIR